MNEVPFTKYLYKERCESRESGGLLIFLVPDNYSKGKLTPVYKRDHSHSYAYNFKSHECLPATK